MAKFWDQLGSKDHPIWGIVKALGHTGLIVVAMIFSVNSFDFDVNGEGGIIAKYLGLLAAAGGGKMAWNKFGPGNGEA